MKLPHKIVPTFFKKKETRLQANSVKVEQNKDGATPFFLLDVLQYQYILSSINSTQNAKNFLRRVSIQQPNFLSANVLQITVKRRVLEVFYSCTYLCRVKQAPLCHLQVTYCWLGLHHD